MGRAQVEDTQHSYECKAGVEHRGGLGQSQVQQDLASLHQLAIDRGTWLVAAECFLETVGAPLSSCARHQLPGIKEAQHSRLLDPRWVESFFQRIRDLEDYSESRQKNGKGFQDLAQGVLPPSEELPDGQMLPSHPLWVLLGEPSISEKSCRSPRGDPRTSTSWKLRRSARANGRPQGKDSLAARSTSVTLKLLLGFGPEVGAAPPLLRRYCNGVYPYTWAATCQAPSASAHGVPYCKSALEEQTVRQPCFGVARRPARELGGGPLGGSGLLACRMQSRCLQSFGTSTFVRTAR